MSGSRLSTDRFPKVGGTFVSRRLFAVKAAIVFILVLVGISAALAVNDPARDYLSTFSPPDGDKAIYSSDTLLRLELDLDGDGQNEVLLSMARDQNGKLGNVWTVYAKVPTGYKKVGTMTFDPKSFYLGPIDELGDYGLLSRSCAMSRFAFCRRPRSSSSSPASSPPRTTRRRRRFASSRSFCPAIGARPPMPQTR